MTLEHVLSGLVGFETLNVPNYLQSVTKYLILTLVFMKNRAPQEKFTCYLSGLFYKQNFYFGKGAGH